MRTALHAESVVAGINGAVDDERNVTVAQVDGIAVLGVPGTAHGNAVDDDVLGVAGMYVEAGGVLDGDALNEHVLAVSHADEVSTALLLFLGGGGDVGIAGFHVPRIPELAVLSLYTSDFLKRLPLDGAHLLALDGTPLCAVAVDDAFARNGDVLTLRGAYGRHALLGVLLVNEQPFVWREEDDGVLVEVQVDVVLEHDGAREPDAGRHDQTSAALLGELADAFSECLCVERQTITYATHVSQHDAVGGDDGCGDLLQCDRQVLIILRVVLCLGSSRQAIEQHSCADSV